MTVLATLTRASIAPSRRYLIVGEHPTSGDVKTGVHYSGHTRKALDSLLTEAGIPLSECRFTTALSRTESPSKYIFLTRKKVRDTQVLVHNRPCDPIVVEDLARLEALIESEKPTIILALGKYALWLLTGESSITSWRGSMIDHSSGALIIPSLSPRVLFKQPDVRYLILRDLQRAAAGAIPPPRENFLIKPTFKEVRDYLKKCHTASHLSWDIETTGQRYIVCVGIARSAQSAICIPFIHANGDSWWSEDEELWIVEELRSLAKEPHTHIGQNFEYDNQYLAHHWGLNVPITHDTLHVQHLLFPGQPKGLSFLSSLYLPYHRHWKDDEKNWGLEGTAQDEFFIYNCRDAVKTFAIVPYQLALLDASPPELQTARKYHDISRSLAFELSLRGVRIDLSARARLAMELGTIYDEQVNWLSEVCEQPINPRSDALMDFFYEDLQLPIQRNYETGQPSLDADALEALARKEPIVRPLVERITRARSVGVVKSTFVESRLDPDGRARSSYNASGTETMRWSSSKSVFGTGMNLQNVPKDAAFGSVRTLYTPDRGQDIFDADLAGADAHVVAAIAAEYGDDSLLLEFNEGGDQHMKNARIIWGNSAGPVERQLAKTVVHACLTGNHEVLTRNGWVPITDKPSEILAVDRHLRGYFTEVSAWHEYEVEAEDLLQFQEQALSFVCTKNHRVPYSTHTNRNSFSVAEAARIPVSGRIPRSVNLIGNHNVPASDAEIRLLAAWHCDGSKTSRYEIRFKFRKQRKIERLTQLLTEANISYDLRHYNDSQDTVFVIKPQHYPKIFFNGFTAGAYMLEWSWEQIHTYLTELMHWDGHFGPSGAQHLSTSDPTQGEWVHTLAHLCGLGSQLAIQAPASGERQTSYRVSLNNRQYARFKRISYTEKGPVQVYCPTVPSGFFLIRHKGKICVTGNSNYGASDTSVSMNTGLSKRDAARFQAIWFEAHPGIRRWHEDVWHQLQTTRTIYSKWGFRKVYFGRPESEFKEALAWVPQHTVAITTNLVADQLRKSGLPLQLLMQVHDSIVFQAPPSLKTSELEPFLICPIPYTPILNIKMKVKRSHTSWGECQ